MDFKNDYSEEILRPEWQRKKAEIMQRDNFICQVCGAKDKQLHVHHTYYDKNLHYWEYPDYMLITLCCNCHNKETLLNKAFKQNAHFFDAKTIDILVSSMKQGVPMIKLIAKLDYLTSIISTNKVQNFPIINKENSDESRDKLFNSLTEPTQLPLANSSIWMQIPFIYSRLTGDFTLMQQKIMLGIINKLQQKISESISDRVLSKTFSDIFEISEFPNSETILMSLSAQDIGVASSHYDDLETAAQQLKNLVIKYPSFQKKGYLIKKYIPTTLFSSIIFPKVVERRTGNFQILLNTKDIIEVLSMQMGYVRLLKNVVSIAKKKRTPRMYILLSRYRSIGHKRMAYSDLLEYLGLTDEYYLQHNSGENPYNNWSNVRIMILEPIRKEMAKLASENKIDFSFDYEPLYPANKRRGKPKEISFIIVKSNDG